MRRWLVILKAFGAGALAAVGVAAGSSVAGTSPTAVATPTVIKIDPVVNATPPTGRYVGTDSIGAVSFNVSVSRRGTRLRARRLVVTNFRFASKCEVSRATVTGKMPVRRGRFGVHAGGITVSGSFHGEFTARFFGSPLASGNARVHRHGCDSGKQKFIANLH